MPTTRRAGIRTATPADKALALVPDNANTLNNYAYFLSLLASTWTRRRHEPARNSAPNQTSYMDTYAWVLFNRANAPMRASGWRRPSRAGSNGGPVPSITATSLSPG
jgi:hypothetical protein